MRPAYDQAIIVGFLIAMCVLIPLGIVFAVVTGLDPAIAVVAIAIGGFFVFWGALHLSIHRRFKQAQDGKANGNQMTTAGWIKKYMPVKYVVLAVIAIGITSCFFLEFLRKSRESEVHVNVTSLATFMENYRDEFGIYTNNLHALGFVPEGSRTLFFLDPKLVPDYLNSHLKENEHPIVQNDYYRLLVLHQMSDRELNVWIYESGQPNAQFVRTMKTPNR